MWWWSTPCAFPGIPIQSVMEKRLVLLVQLGGPQQIIHVLVVLSISISFMRYQFLPIRTVKTMRNAYKQSLAAPTKTAAEAILKDHGLHKIIVSFSIVLSEINSIWTCPKNAFLVHSQFWSISCCLLWYTAFWWHRKNGESISGHSCLMSLGIWGRKGYIQTSMSDMIQIYSPKVRLLTFCLKHETGAFMAKSEAFWLNYNNGFLRWPGVLMPWR